MITVYTIVLMFLTACISLAFAAMIFDVKMSAINREMEEIRHILENE